MTSEKLKKEVKNLSKSARDAISTASSLEELRGLEIEFLGRKGKLTLILRSLGKVSPEERAEIGRLANELRESLEEEIALRKEVLEREILEKKFGEEAVDVTLPGKVFPLGKKHLVTQIIDEVVEIFVGLGYRVAEGPEVELDYYNFEALNMPPGHPARSLWDTIYVESSTSGVLLRTHTSPVQVRVMEKTKPPLYIIVPGKVYRHDTPDATHLPMFYQIEGLAVDKGITFGDLKGTLEVFAHRMFGKERKTRFRPSFFPFTEPSAEVDVSCVVCDGGGCSLCKGSGWLEILGAGMVDPNVLEVVGYNPEEVSGFAFGMGVERIAMLKHGVTDIRLFFENDLRFLRQF